MADRILTETADPTSDEARALLSASHRFMKSLYPADWCHVMDPEELLGEDISFLLARVDGIARGCAALALRDGYAEIKSMYVDPEARGTGLGRRLIVDLLARAQSAGHHIVRLETGPDLVPAVRLYRSLGFRPCGAFGNYPDVSESLFMELNTGREASGT